MAQQKHYCCGRNKFYFYLSTVLVFLVSSMLLSSYNALEFDVGGNEGWVENPSEGYNQWAARMRFQVNDTLLFRYEAGRDSVLEVEVGDYDKCNADTPIRKMDNGYSIFKLDRSGPFHFISGNRESCEKGQKIVVIVVALKNQSTTPVAKGCPSTARAPPTTGPPVTPLEVSPPTPSEPVTDPAVKAPPPVSPSITPPEVSPPTPSDATSYGCPNTPPANVAPVAEPPDKGSPVLSPNTPSSDVVPVAEPDTVASNTLPPSPPPGEGCNISDIRSDPANVLRKPPKSFAAAPARTRISTALVVAIMLTICI